MKAPTYYFVLFTNGILLTILSGIMLVPGILDYATHNIDWEVFALSSATTLFSGLILIFTTAGGHPRIGTKEGFLLTVSCWLSVGLFSSLPLAFSSLDISFTDAVFETMSGLTTTGSTVLSGLDTMAPGLLLWRSLLQWIGGIGIVVMAMVILPALRIGGMQLFRSESSDISEKAVPRVYEMAKLIAFVYVGLSAACAIALRFSGMTWFDAINHAMTTIATGGYSTRDASIGFYDSVPIEAVTTVFMIAGALPLILYARLLMQGRRALMDEFQVPTFLGILALAVVLTTGWNITANEMPIGTAFRFATFNITSILTDTGFATADFSTWGSFAVGVFFLLFFIGGCAGSTAGAIKIFRWRILFASARRQLRQMLVPHRVLILRYGTRPVDGDMLDSVRNFFFLYIGTFAALSMLLMGTGLDFLSSTSAVAQAMANAGPGLGPVVGPGTNFATLTDGAKWLLVAGMLMGRLELATVYVVLLGDFWRH